jgi:hypothetical protein
MIAFACALIAKFEKFDRFSRTFIILLLPDISIEDIAVAQTFGLKEIVR